MAQSNVDLNKQIAERNPGKIAVLDIQAKLEKWKTEHGDKLAALSGSKDTADKVFVICMNTISKNPDLLSCTFSSIASCILQCFQLGLYPGAFQECAFVPLNNSKINAKEANFWPQYQGLVKLMLNAGNKAVVARVVFENDYFEYHEGDKAPVYAPAVILGKKRGKPLFTYSAVCTVHGHWQVEVLDFEQIENTKKRSRGASRSDSPWNAKDEKIDDFYLMCAKTALKRVGKWCTKSAELVTAMQLDNEVDGDPAYQKGKIIDISDHAGIPLQEPEAGEPKSLDAPKESQSLDFSKAGSKANV